MSRWLAASALLVAGTAGAQPPAAGPFDASAPQNREVLPAFSYETVEPVLVQVGARFERAGGSEPPALTITFANGRRAAILFGSCLGASSCRAISIQAVWVAPPNASAAQLAAAVATFNQRYAFSRAFIAADGRPSLQRYLTADFGFIRGNLAVNLIVFAGQIDRFVSEVLQAPSRAGSTAVVPLPSSPAPATDPAAPRRRPGAGEPEPRN